MDKVEKVVECLFSAMLRVGHIIPSKGSSEYNRIRRMAEAGAAAIEAYEGAMGEGGGKSFETRPSPSTVTDDFNPFTHKLSEAELDEVEAVMTGKPKATVTDEGLVELKPLALKIALAVQNSHFRATGIPEKKELEAFSEQYVKDAYIMLEASGHTALLREIKALREALEMAIQMLDDGQFAYPADWLTLTSKGE